MQNKFLQGTWVSKKIQLQESPVHGKGFFSVESIKKDEVLIIQSGTYLSVYDIDQDPELGKHAYHGFQVDDEFYIYPFFNGDTPLLTGIFLVNHSCDPTAGFKGQISLVALRDIEPGKEITFDYVMTDKELEDEIPWIPEECKCGSSSCRKFITGNDWKSKGLQQKYKGYFSTHIQKAIERLDLEIK